jgi:hypothetical protein
VLLVDISPDAAQSRMLEYLSAVVKEVLGRPEFDDTIVQLYTFTDIVQEYDFGGAEVKCVVVDRSIKSDLNVKIVLPALRECRVRPGICRKKCFGLSISLKS